MQSCSWTGLGLTVGLAFAASPVVANINLEFRPLAQTVFVTDTVELGLFAVSDDEGGQPLAAIDLIFAWDPDFLQLLDIDGTGAVSLLASGFPLNDPFNLNEEVPPQDGDGFYQALANFGSPVEATPEGALITTFLFEAIDETFETFVEMLVFGGSPVGETVVWDGLIPNTNVTGSLGTAGITIIPEPATLYLLGLAAAALSRRQRRTRKKAGENRQASRAV